MKTLKKVPTIGLIGLGNQGKKHLDSIINLQNKNLVRLVGICDTSTKKFSNSTNIPFYYNYKDLYSKAKPEIVLISTPNYLHKRMALDALSRSIYVIKEKPLAINYLDASEMILASQHYEKLLITTQQRFFFPLLLKTKNIIPTLGKIVSFTYRFTLNDTKRSWYWDLEKAGGGSWLNMGWHAVSVINWLIGDIETIKLTWNISGRRKWSYKTDHSSFAKVVIGNNIVGSIFVSCVHPTKEESLKIIFSKGILYVSRNCLKVFMNKKKQKIYHSFANDRFTYDVQLKNLLKNIHNNSYDQKKDSKTMAVIQAGINSINSKSSMMEVKKIYNRENNTLFQKNNYVNT